MAARKRHGRALIRACREAFEAGSFLIELMNRMPLDAKWDVIGDVRLGKNASDELRAEFLNKV